MKAKLWSFKDGHDNNKPCHGQGHRTFHHVQAMIPAARESKNSQLMKTRNVAKLKKGKKYASG